MNFTSSDSPILPRLALWTLMVLASVLFVVGVPAAAAGDGGISPTSEEADSSDGQKSDANNKQGKAAKKKRRARRVNRRYRKVWKQTARRQKRWARSTSECESNKNPRAIGGGGRYRGAFQFMKQTWRAAPKSPGGDPIRYSYATQAVVAIALKKSDGPHHWPHCG